MPETPQQPETPEEPDIPQMPEELFTDTMLTKTTHTVTYDKDGKKIVVPAGFKILVDSTTEYTADNISVEKGVVIQDKDKNEFVWIPVNDLNKFARLQAGSTENYRGVLYDWTTSGYPEISWSEDSTSYREPDVVKDYDGSYLSNMGITTDLNKDSKTDISDAKYQLQKEFNNMVKSVDEYDGFYVGRYEMSYNGSSAQSKRSTESNPITSSNGDNSATYMWYGLYSKAKKYTNANNSVQSSMIWGCQYDAMISFMGAKAHEKIGDKRNQSYKTGSVEDDKLKNVYDLYGNRYEWTLEANRTVNRVLRGGNCLNSRFPSQRGLQSPNCDGFGSRLSLYIKVQD